MSGFEDTILERLSGVLDQVEKIRVQALADKRRARNMCIIIGVIAGALGLLLLVAAKNPILLIISVAVGGGICYFTYHSICGDSLKKFRYAYKTRLVAGIAKELQPEMEFHPYRGISKDLFKSCGHYTTGIDRYATEDLFEGKIGATKLFFGELHAEYKTTSTDSKGRRSTKWHTIFQGVMLVADFHKHFQTWVTVRPDNERDGLFGWIGQKIQGFSNSLVKLESPVFEKHFRVNAGDATGAMYILTPDMQERLLALRDSLGGGIIVSFQKSSICITAPKSHDWFEANIAVSAISKNQIRTLASQIQHYFRIVETLNLNTRIWTKD